MSRRGSGAQFAGGSALFELGVPESGVHFPAAPAVLQLHESNKSSVAEAGVELNAKLYYFQRELRGKDREEVLPHRRKRSTPVASVNANG